MRKMFVISLLVLLVFLISCTSAEKSCIVDNDCVVASCCHAVDAVNKAHAPDCTGVACTLSCEPGTLDCAQGEIKCQSNKCVAVIS